MPLILLTEEHIEILQQALKSAKKKQIGRPKGSKDSELTRLRKSAAQRERYKNREERLKTSEAKKLSIAKKKEEDAGIINGIVKVRKAEEVGPAASESGA